VYCRRVAFSRRTKRAGEHYRHTVAFSRRTKRPGKHYRHTVAFSCRTKRAGKHYRHTVVATCIYRALNISFFGPQKVHISRSERYPESHRATMPFAYAHNPYATRGRLERLLLMSTMVRRFLMLKVGRARLVSRTFWGSDASLTLGLMELLVDAFCFPCYLPFHVQAYQGNTGVMVRKCLAWKKGKF
jgi:hypothetical protein